MGNPRGTLFNGLYYLKLDPFDIKTAKISVTKDWDWCIVLTKKLRACWLSRRQTIPLSHLAKQFFDHTTSRKIHCYGLGEPESEHGTVNKFIGRSTRNRQLYTVYPDGDQGKHAVTHWSMLEDYIMYPFWNVFWNRAYASNQSAYAKHRSSGFQRWTIWGDKILKGTIYSKYKQFVENLFAGFPSACFTC